MNIFKRTILLLALLINGAAYASDYKVVFDLTSDKSEHWASLLNNLENVKRELGAKTKLAVVFHGNGLAMILQKTQFQKERMLKLAKDGVEFLACENTMKRKKVIRKDLYDFAATVPAGLADIIRKQRDGWAYIKIGQ